MRQLSLITRNPADASLIASRIEKSGFDGLFTFEGPHDPFLQQPIKDEHALNHYSQIFLSQYFHVELCKLINS